jgi:hypothetical protein
MIRSSLRHNRYRRMRSPWRFGVSDSTRRTDWISSSDIRLIRWRWCCGFIAASGPIDLASGPIDLSQPRNEGEPFRSRHLPDRSQEFPGWGAASTTSLIGHCRLLQVNHCVRSLPATSLLPGRMATPQRGQSVMLLPPMGRPLLNIRRHGICHRCQGRVGNPR